MKLTCRSRSSEMGFGSDVSVVCEGQFSFCRVVESSHKLKVLELATVDGGWWGGGGWGGTRGRKSNGARNSDNDNRQQTTALVLVRCSPPIDYINY